MCSLVYWEVFFFQCPLFKREREASFAGSFSKSPQQPGLGQVEVRVLEISLSSTWMEGTQVLEPTPAVSSVSARLDLKAQPVVEKVTPLFGTQNLILEY